MKTLFNITDAINELLIRIILKSKNETVSYRTFTKWEDSNSPHEQPTHLPSWLETMPKAWRLPRNVSHKFNPSLQLRIIG